MKKRFYIAAIILTVLFGVMAGGSILAMQDDAPAPAENSIDEHAQSIDYSCTEDKDCVVKDVGNCCGYYPACVNVDATPNPDLVRKQCEEMGVAGICGFPSIESCACVDNKCQPAGQNQQE